MQIQYYMQYGNKIIHILQVVIIVIYLVVTKQQLYIHIQHQMDVIQQRLYIHIQHQMDVIQIKQYIHIQVVVIQVIINL